MKSTSTISSQKLCLVLKGQETGERRIERQSHAKFAGHFLGNKLVFLKANKTHTYTCKLAWQKKSCLCLDFQLRDPIVSFRHFRCFTCWKPIVQTYGEENIPYVNAKPANIVSHRYPAAELLSQPFGNQVVVSLNVTSRWEGLCRRHE